MRPATLLLVPIVCCLFPASARDPWPALEDWAGQPPLEGTLPLEMTGDLSLKLVRLNDAFLDRQIQRATERRASRWQDDDSVEKNRELLRRLLGLHRDRRAEEPDPHFAGFADAPGLTIRRVRWRAFGQVHGSGVIIEPSQGESRADVILVHDADHDPGDCPEALRLAASGCRVLLPAIVSRAMHERYKMSNREWLHRPAFELGRTLIGYELHLLQSAADWFFSPGEDRSSGILGMGEGGLLALYAGALDERFQSVGVAGYFGPREGLWNEPAERNVFGFLTTFGDAEVARLVSPRPLLICHERTPDYVFRPGEDGRPERLEMVRPALAGKPGAIPRFTAEQTRTEWTRIPPALRENSRCLAGFDDLLSRFSEEIGVTLPAGGIPLTSHLDGDWVKKREARLLREIEAHTQQALNLAAADRKEAWKTLDTGSLEGFRKTIEPFREQFRTEVIGDFGLPRKPFRARSRSYQKGPGTVSYEVVLDVMDEVIAYGILTLPADLDLASGEKRPVVVCQHGLEGTPQDVVGEAKFRAYQAFATRLAEEGFITFAPQNGYKYFDLFRIQQFKAQSIGKTLFSTIVPQHRQITDWLASLPFADGERIAFYGLSYGGKSAMRIPPLVPRYCLSICSADFNEWVWKNAATDPMSLRYSYANKGEYEIFEWNLGGTFNYAEMAALIAPRPFMVERGHFDGVAPDEQVAFEFAKVRHLYQAKLGLGDRCEIEWFVGPHSINGEGTFRFLRKHLNLSR